MKDQIIIIRHARSEMNLRLNDNPDACLTPFGKGQALRVGRFLRKHMDVGKSEFFTSPYLRCLETSAIIHEAMELCCARFSVDLRLKEYINHSHKEVNLAVHKEKFKQFEFNWLLSPSYAHQLSFKIEANEEVMERLHSFYGDLPARSVVVTHGLPALALLEIATRNASDLPCWDHGLDNASITLIRRGRVIWRGRNLYHETNDDPFDKVRAFDTIDGLVKKG